MTIRISRYRMDMTNLPFKGMKTGSFYAEFDNGNSGTGTREIDWTISSKQRITLTANCDFIFTAPPGSCNLTLKLIQDSSGSRTVTWPSSVKWKGGTGPTLTSTASAVDIVAFYYDGTYYYGTANNDFK